VHGRLGEVYGRSAVLGFMVLGFVVLIYLGMKSHPCGPFLNLSVRSIVTSSLPDDKCCWPIEGMRSVVDFMFYSALYLSREVVR